MSAITGPNPPNSPRGLRQPGQGGQIHLEIDHPTPTVVSAAVEEVEEHVGT
jgi:hypothetical protein